MSPNTHTHTFCTYCTATDRHFVSFAPSFLLNLSCRSNQNELIFFFPSLCHYSSSWPLILLMFSTRVISTLSPAPLTRGLLHFDVCLLLTRPFVLFHVSTPCLVRDTLRLWISSHLPHGLFFSSEITSTLFLSLHGSSFHHLVLRVPPLFRHSLKITPSLLLSAESSHSLPYLCPPSLLCCSMGNTGNHGEQVCDIHGDLAVVRYEQCLRLLACRGVNWWRDIFVCMIESQGRICHISPQMLSL